MGGVHEKETLRNETCFFYRQTYGRYLGEAFTGSLLLVALTSTSFFRERY